MSAIDRYLLEMRLADWKFGRHFLHLLWIFPSEILALNHWMPLP